MADPVLTQISGFICAPFGDQLTTGNLIISLSSSFISIDGNRVSPFVKTVAVAGDFSFSLFATENSVVGGAYSDPDPLGVRYTIEYDPEPSNQSVALVRKNGYFRNTISVPHLSDTPASNVTSWGDIIPTEYQYITKLYGILNLLDNDPRLLTLAQKTALTGGGNASAYHSHAVGGSSFISLEPSNPMVTPATDKIAIQYSETILGGVNSVNLLFENSEVITLFYA